MAIDFEEEQQPKSKLATCSTHKLKYDSAVSWGCVLCTKNQTKRISGYVVVGGLLLAGALAFLISQNLPGDESSPRPPIQIGAPAASTEDAPIDEEAGKCLLTVSEEIEDCLGELTDTDATQMDREMCLSPLADVREKCPGTCSEEDAVYVLGECPGWAAVREPIEQRQESIEQCLGGTDYEFGLRISVLGKEGTPAEVLLSTFGLSASQRFCVRTLLAELTYPAKPHDYTIVAFANSQVFARNRPAQEDQRDEEFKQFLKEQRERAASDERRAEIKQKREAVNQREVEEIRNTN